MRSPPVSELGGVSCFRSSSEKCSYGTGSHKSQQARRKLDQENLLMATSHRAATIHRDASLTSSLSISSSTQRPAVTPNDRKNRLNATLNIGLLSTLSPCAETRKPIKYEMANSYLYHLAVLWQNLKPFWEFSSIAQKNITSLRLCARIPSGCRIPQTIPRPPCKTPGKDAVSCPSPGAFSMAPCVKALQRLYPEHKAGDCHRAKFSNEAYWAWPSMVPTLMLRSSRLMMRSTRPSRTHTTRSETLSIL